MDTVKPHRPHHSIFVHVQRRINGQYLRSKIHALIKCGIIITAPHTLDSENYSVLLQLRNQTTTKFVVFFSASDIAFHQAVGEAAHNALIGHLSAALLRLMHDNIRLNLGELMGIPAANALLASQHAAIFAAIREHKPSEARAAAETHIDFVRETLAQTLRSVARRESAARRLNQNTPDFSETLSS